jgi:hypothetical protein
MSDRFKKFVAKLKQLTTLCLVVRCSNLCCVFVEIGGGGGGVNGTRLLVFNLKKKNKGGV